MASTITNVRDYNNRDCTLFHKGDTMPMRISESMAARGWAGGTFVKWVDDGTGEPVLDIADGRYCGFAPFGSNETGDRFTAMTGQNPHYKYISMFYGGNFLATRTYERYTYASRHSGGALVPLVYQSQQFLYISENGKTTTEDESDVSVNAAQLFPDGSPILVPFLFFGLCSVPPSAASNYFLWCQTNVGV